TAKPAKYIDPTGEYTADAPASDISIAWEAGDTEEVRERNLERIITQKWIAIFPLGIEAWSEYRRTGYPRLLPVVENKSGGTVDSRYGLRRIPYPVEEYTENPVHLQAAIDMLGGRDNGGVHVWWDVKPLQ
ncbi:SusD/RagB family nutrient-binding outer membrane lipoprotein, partial [uncultured Alistipes sp.]|uniref:SusD/RagB family nutrient-binding outer membrane lipoprotein n=1 Tax=uncultured Alistipes sp. TaxID=538949 RepID=UPI00263583AA